MGVELEGKRSRGRRSIGERMFKEGGGQNGQLGRHGAGLYAVLSGKIGGRGPVNVMSKALVNRSTATFARFHLPHKI